LIAGVKGVVLQLCFSTWHDIIIHEDFKRSVMNKRVILIVIGIIVAVAGFLYFTRPAEEVKADPSNHTSGNGSTGVVLMEYGDFQCPACAQYFPILAQVKEKYKDHITFQFRHFPLESIHKNARAASRAAEAAGRQGKFWEMHDLLYQNQTAWQEASDPLSVFEGYAQAAGVQDLEKFKVEMRGADVNAVINADLNLGRELGASSTPTFVLDGKRLEENPSPSLEAFSLILDQAIKDKGGTPPATESATPTDQTTPTE
jgi:protein-disulfide isomerase